MGVSAPARVSAAVPVGVSALARVSAAVPVEVFAVEQVAVLPQVFADCQRDAVAFG